jgi:hypothetical protein
MLKVAAEARDRDDLGNNNAVAVTQPAAPATLSIDVAASNRNTNNTNGNRRPHTAAETTATIAAAPAVSTTTLIKPEPQRAPTPEVLSHGAKQNAETNATSSTNVATTTTASNKQNDGTAVGVDRPIPETNGGMSSSHIGRDTPLTLRQGDEQSGHMMDLLNGVNTPTPPPLHDQQHQQQQHQQPAPIRLDLLAGASPTPPPLNEQQHQQQQQQQPAPIRLDLLAGASPTPQHSQSPQLSTGTASSNLLHPRLKLQLPSRLSSSAPTTPVLRSRGSPTTPILTPGGTDFISLLLQAAQSRDGGESEPMTPFTPSWAGELVGCRRV